MKVSVVAWGICSITVVILPLPCLPTNLCIVLLYFIGRGIASYSAVRSVPHCLRFALRNPIYMSIFKINEEKSTYLVIT
eukprot:scaffold12442_cov84-Skeletonema_dohrnii-CCMP3373.AAC.1